MLPDAARRSYDVLVTNDSRQLDNPDETRAIRDSGMHHVRYHQDTRRGVDGLASAMAAVMAAIRPIVRELEASKTQLLIEIQRLAQGKRHTAVDPAIDPPPYRPSHAGQPNRRKRKR